MPSPDWHAPLRLRLDGSALVANWRWLAARSGAAACGAAVKADGYGLGARAVVTRLAAAGCRDFFVATWGEAAALGDLAAGCSIAVLHGVRGEDMALATTLAARPVLNTLDQIARWQPTRRPCDVMVDTGMNRLGIAPADVTSGALAGLHVDTVMSHLACADEDVAMNERQRAAFAAVAAAVPGARASLANSAGICLGTDYAFHLTRPGLALYGGVPRAEAAGSIAAVAIPQAQVLQRRLVRAGDSVGYNATWRATRDTDVAILNIGYADGYARLFAGVGSVEGMPVIGRVSMDLISVDATGRDVGEGDWLAVDYDLATLAARTGRSQYELLTALGSRFDRVWG